MVHGRYGTQASETLYVSGGGISTHQLWGLGGNDILYGWTPDNPELATSDELYGDRTPQPGEIQYDPNQTPAGDPGNDTLYGGAGFDKLYGDQGNDDLYGGADSDRMYGGTGDDYLDGGEGDDTLYGGQGWGVNEIGTGNDVLVAWTGNDLIYGGDGNDWLDGSYDNDTLYGGDGDDTLGNSVVPEPGDDLMYGGRGNDKLFGGDGNDLLNGYGGDLYERDTLIGGANADKFVLGTTDNAFYSGDGIWGYATIVDFHKNSQGDQIIVYGIKDDYRLDTSSNFSGSSTNDTAIYYKNDLIAVVEDKIYTSRSDLLTFGQTPF